jgi:hypothetical protein
MQTSSSHEKELQILTFLVVGSMTATIKGGNDAVSKEHSCTAQFRPFAPPQGGLRCERPSLVQKPHSSTSGWTD